MYNFLLAFHSFFRWAVLIALVWGIFTGLRGFLGNKPFSKRDNFIRHSTATFAHVQLAVGFTLYVISPITKYFIGNMSTAISNPQMAFFGVVHFLLMLTSVVFITIGSALAKRKTDPKAKFRTMLIWFSLGLLIILLAIPWPFMPWVQRPYIRPF
jgi:drug/metabolite transporter (DMT)-like permease